VAHPFGPPNGWVHGLTQIGGNENILLIRRDFMKTTKYLFIFDALAKNHAAICIIN
jgi:hypothetical protein